MKFLLRKPFALYFLYNLEMRNLRQKCSERSQYINEDQLSTISEVTSRQSLSYWTCQQMMGKDQNMQPTNVKFLPWLLTDTQRHQHVFVCLKLLEIKPGFTFMIQKPNSSPISGEALVHILTHWHTQPPVRWPGSLGPLIHSRL